MHYLILNSPISWMITHFSDVGAEAQRARLPAQCTGTQSSGALNPLTSTICCTHSETPLPLRDTVSDHTASCNSKESFFFEEMKTETHSSVGKMTHFLCPHMPALPSQTTMNAYGGGDDWGRRRAKRMALRWQVFCFPYILETLH